MLVTDISIEELPNFYTIVKKTIVGSFTSTRFYQFPKTDDGYVLIPIYSRPIGTLRVVKVRSVVFREDGDKLCLESTADYPCLQTELEEFLRTWYSYWILMGEGEFVA